MTTRREVLAKAFPEHMERIEELTDRRGYLDGKAVEGAANILFVAFAWGATFEGHKFWETICIKQVRKEMST